MQIRVFVLDAKKKPLSPCHPARARELLKKGRAAVYRREPFTIILKEEKPDAEVQPLRLKVDPGSETTGLALVLDRQNGAQVIWAAELQHRREQIRVKMLRRRQWRRNRRHRKCRYRPPRFDNQTGRPDGWLPSSLQSLVDNVETWVARLCGFAPVSALSVELAKFDTQRMVNPDIEGIECQHGTLRGYDVRQYLLEKWGYQCTYCGVKEVPLEIEHISPKSRGGSDRIGNLTVSCIPCNREKGNQTAAEYGFPEMQEQAKDSLRDIAAVNSTCWHIYDILKATGFPVETRTGSRTKFNRHKQNYPKAHWIDAACVGKSDGDMHLDTNMQILLIEAAGRGSRQMCLMGRYGFPRTKPKQYKEVHGFRTGDLVRAVVPEQLKTGGTHYGRVSIRSSGSFRIGRMDGINWQYCELIQRNDGYKYTRRGAPSSQG